MPHKMTESTKKERGKSVRSVFRHLAQKGMNEAAQRRYIEGVITCTSKSSQAWQDGTTIPTGERWEMFQMIYEEQKRERAAARASSATPTTQDPPPPFKPMQPTPEATDALIDALLTERIDRMDLLQLANLMVLINKRAMHLLEPS